GGRFDGPVMDRQAPEARGGGRAPGRRPRESGPGPGASTGGPAGWPRAPPAPTLALEPSRQLLPAVAPDAGGPGDERVDRDRDRQARHCPQHLVGARLPERPPLHQRVELDSQRVDSRTAPHPYPAIQNDENDQADEQHALGDGDDEKELTARHLPTQRLIFSRATRRLIGFTR